MWDTDIGTGPWKQVELLVPEASDAFQVEGATAEKQVRCGHRSGQVQPRKARGGEAGTLWASWVAVCVLGLSKGWQGGFENLINRR